MFDWVLIAPLKQKHCPTVITNNFQKNTFDFNTVQIFKETIDLILIKTIYVVII